LKYWSKIDSFKPKFWSKMKVFWIFGQIFSTISNFRIFPIFDYFKFSNISNFRIFPVFDYFKFSNIWNFRIFWTFRQNISNFSSKFVEYFEFFIKMLPKKHLLRQILCFRTVKIISCSQVQLNWWCRCELQKLVTYLY